MKCRNCSIDLTETFIDLGATPPSNSFLSKNDLLLPEIYYPLKVMVCNECFLVQIDEHKKSEKIFDQDYVYFSSYSKSWLEHAKTYCDKVITKFNLGPTSFVVEIASNDGYLLKNFLHENIPCLGIEPSSGTAIVARDKGIETLENFFGCELAKDLQKSNRMADLIIGNNVLAHVPDIHDFVEGFTYILKPNGVVTLEFPHLIKLIEDHQFDTIYHEHFSYLSFAMVCSIFKKHKMRVFDVEKLSTHGGSLRVYACRENATFEKSKTVDDLINAEEKIGVKNLEYYKFFQEKAEEIKLSFLDFMIQAKHKGKKIAGYGAAAKGNTFLNYAGVKSDLLPFVVDLSPHKQNKFLPGSRIPVYGLDKLKKYNPDYIIIFPWNLKNEILNQLKGDFPKTEFVTFIPKFEILK